MEAEALWLSYWSAESGPGSCEGLLTVHGLYGVGDVQFAAGRQRSQEGRRIIGALETLAGLQEALAIVHLQVHDGAAREMRKHDSDVEGWNRFLWFDTSPPYYQTPVFNIIIYLFIFRNFRFTEEKNDDEKFGILINTCKKKWKEIWIGCICI